MGTIVKWQAYGLNEIELDIPPTVYPPREDTGLLDRTLAKLDSTKGNRLLEIGCGSGAVSIAAALRGWNVSACDVNPLAIAATRGNAAKLGIEWETEIREGGPGDIGNWEPQQGVDVIAWNLPYIEPDSGKNLGPMEDSALIGQDEAEQLLNAISANPRLLNPGGVVLMLHS
ncbi:MAG: class I SAM-dependent methyltransferase, partial [Candidatus Poseidoniales archaeon]|nr:class I SAM-dependent methyltransferase [Candidatus Poseidoniales archaeon]